MRKGFKRFLSASLAVLVLCTTALTNVYAGTPSQASNTWSPAPTPSGHPGNGKNATPGGREHGGVRITVTNMSQAGEAGIAPVELGDNYTAAINQFNDLAAILKTKV